CSSAPPTGTTTRTRPRASAGPIGRATTDPLAVRLEAGPELGEDRRGQRGEAVGPELALSLGREGVEEERHERAPLVEAESRDGSAAPVHEAGVDERVRELADRVRRPAEGHVPVVAGGVVDRPRVRRPETHSTVGPGNGRDERAEGAVGASGEARGE